MSKQANVFPGKSYALFSATGGAVTAEDGATTLFVLAAGVQDIRPAQVAVWLVPDDTVVTELFSRALGGAGTSSSGGGSGEGGGLTPAEAAVLYGAAQRAGDNTLSGSNSFTGSVDLSSATVVPPAGWIVTGLTDAQQAALDGAAQLAGSNSFTGSVDLSSATVTPPAYWQLDVPASDNTFTGSNAFTGSVNLSAATVTPPADWLLVDNVYSSGMPGVLETAHIYDLGELAADTDLSAVAFTADATKVQTCELWLSLGATAYSVTWPAGLVWLDSEPVLAAGKYYRFALRCEPNGTIIGNLAYEYTA